MKNKTIIITYFIMNTDFFYLRIRNKIVTFVGHSVLSAKIRGTFRNICSFVCLLFFFVTHDNIRFSPPIAANSIEKTFKSTQSIQIFTDKKSNVNIVL